MKVIICTFLLLGSIILFGFSSKEKDIVAEFYNQLQGEYSSEAQSKEDTSYFNIYLAMYPIWTDRTDGKWLYVEQAMATKREKPYRQRIYQIKKGNNNEIISIIYTFENPLEYTNAQQNKDILRKLTYDKISSKIGCEVYMKPTKSGFEGGTKGKECQSNLRGASYTTTQIKMENDKLISWDRGFFSDGKQAWGAEKGGYIFVKQKTF
jgi:hypothetical protein